MTNCSFFKSKTFVVFRLLKCENVMLTCGINLNISGIWTFD